MRHTSFKYPGFLVTCAALLWPGSAFAAEPAGATGRAAQLYQEGNTFYDQNKLVEAEARYQAAWDIQRSFEIAGNLGNVELEVNQPRDAAEHLSYALENFPAHETPAKKQFLQKRLAEAKRQIGEVTVVVNVAGADVIIGGRLVGRSPMQAPIFLDPGEHEVEARRGSKTARELLVVGKGSRLSVALTIDTMPNMTIVIAGGAAGLVGLGMGTTFAILSNGKASDAEALRATGGPRDELRSLRDDQAMLANLSFWSFVGGGAALAGTAAYVLTTQLGQPAPAFNYGIQAAPLVLAKGSGLVVSGSF